MSVMQGESQTEMKREGSDQGTREAPRGPREACTEREANGNGAICMHLIEY